MVYFPKVGCHSRHKFGKIKQRGEKMNFFYNKKNQKIIAGAIALILVVAMVVTMVASF